MDIVNNLKGKMAIAVFLIVGGMIGNFFLRNTELLIVALLCACCLVILVKYPVLAVLIIIGGTSLIDYHGKLPFTEIGSIHIPDLVLFFLMGAVIFRFLILRIKPVRTPLDLAIIIFVGVGTARLLVGFLEEKYLFFLGLREFKPILYYLLPILVVNIVKDKKELKFLIYGCLVFGVISALTVVLTAWVNPPTAMGDPGEIFYRYQFGSRGWMLCFWSLFLFICLLLQEKMRLMYFLGTGIFLFALIISFTRHLWISFCAGGSLIVLFSFKRIKARIFCFSSLAIILLFLVATAAFFGVEPVATYVKLIILRGESLTLQRIDNWEIRMEENRYAMDRIIDEPFFGIGFVAAYRPQIYGPRDDIEWFIHNGYLWILLKMGIAGFLPFVWLSYIFISRGMKYWPFIEDRLFRGIVLGSVCSFMGIAVGNIAVAHFIQNWQVAVFGISFGINELIYKIERVEGADRTFGR